MCDQQSLRSACAYAQSDQSLCQALKYTCNMAVELLIDHHLEFISLKGCSTCLSKSTHVKMPHCKKSYVIADLSVFHFLFLMAPWVGL